MPKLYSYIIKNDSGAAPNPFWGLCTLAICKPAIRRTASVGDWIIATGSKNAKCNDLNIHDLSGSIVFAMKVSKKMPFEDYDQYCKEVNPKKIPNWRTKDWRDKVGDCIYNFEDLRKPTIRLSVHNEESRKRDLGGLHVLLSDHFYYFGEEARQLPSAFHSFIKKTQGHLITRDEKAIIVFEKWIKQFQKNKIYSNPQLRWKFDKNQTPAIQMKCATATKKTC